MLSEKRKKEEEERKGGREKERKKKICQHTGCHEPCTFSKFIQNMHGVKPSLAAEDVVLQYIQMPSEFVSLMAESWREKEINQSCCCHLE